MSNLIVGISDCQWSAAEDTSIITYALGSCIAVCLYDPRAKVGGMLHFMLPESDLNREKAQRNPYTFADSGIPILFRKAYELGALKSRLLVHAAFPRWPLPRPALAWWPFTGRLSEGDDGQPEDKRPPWHASPFFYSA